MFRILYVDHVQPATARFTTCAAPDRVRKSGGLVDDDVVGTVDLAVMRRFLEGHGRIADVTQLSEIEDLHAVLSGAVGDDEHVIAIHLHVTPGTCSGCFRLGQIAEVHRV